MLKQGKYIVDEIILHQTTTRPEWMANKSVEEKVAEIDRWHKARGWRGFGYHYLVDRDGKVGEGRPVTQIGAHVRGRNRGSIGICLAGGFGATKDDPFERHFTPEQDEAVRELIDELKGRANIRKVSGHSQYANKACPGFNVRKWIKPPALPREHIASSTTVQVSAGQLTAGGVGFLTALSSLSGTAQLVALGLCTVLMMSAAYIMRERIVKWAEGVK